MINDTQKFIFSHIPKNAGTSIEKALAKVPDTLDISKIEQSRREALVFKKTNSNPEYCFFAFVRNPYDRIVSVYRHSMRKRRHFPKLSFSQYCIALQDYFIEKLDDGWLSTFDKRHARPQTFFIPNAEGFLMGQKLNTIPKNVYIGNFENLSEHFIELLNNLKIKNISLPHVSWGSAKKANYEDYFDENSYEIIQLLYGSDFAHFDYQK